MRFRTWALAAAFCCGCTGVMDAAARQPAVQQARQQKVAKQAKAKRTKAPKIKRWKPKKVKRTHK